MRSIYSIRNEITDNNACITRLKIGLDNNGDDLIAPEIAERQIEELRAKNRNLNRQRRAIELWRRILKRTGLRKASFPYKVAR